MTVRLVFLGRLHDVAGSSERTVTSGSLTEIFAALDPALALALFEERVRWALNGELLTERGVIQLQDGDELAFLPPVSGG